MTSLDPTPDYDIVEILTGSEITVDWLIPGFIATGTLVALGGQPGSGKSYLSYNLALGLATGTPVLGFEMKPASVLYFDQENSYYDARQYMRWAWRALGSPDIELVKANFHWKSFKLGGSDWSERAMGYVQSHQPRLIIIDTTTPACNIQDENDNAEAAQTVNHIRRLQAAVSPVAAVLALKHSRENDHGDTLRGAKTWEGAVDSIVHHKRHEGRPRVDGLTNTDLIPTKTRAFGLRDRVQIVPQWVEGKTGLALNRR